MLKNAKISRKIQKYLHEFRINFIKKRTKPNILGRKIEDLSFVLMGKFEAKSGKKLKNHLKGKFKKILSKNPESVFEEHNFRHISIFFSCQIS